MGRGVGSQGSALFKKGRWLELELPEEALLIRTGGEDNRLLGVEVHVSDNPVVARELVYYFGGVHVPDVDVPVRGANGDLGAVGGPSTLPGRTNMCACELCEEERDSGKGKTRATGAGPREPTLMRSFSELCMWGSPA